MTRRRIILGCVSVGMALGGILPALAAPKRSRAMQALDADNDGTIDLDEARKAAGGVFDRIDGNKDGNLNRRELGGRVTPAEFAAADRNRDGKLSKEEYLSVVEKRFRAADPNNNGKIEEKELLSRAGRPLLRLLLP
jgi:Ca2+-binding EF-hand superfamily protein